MKEKKQIIHPLRPRYLWKKQTEKPYFAQNDICDAFNHRAKYFHTIEEARTWLAANGGGTIKKKGAGVVHDPFVGDIRVMTEVERVEKDGTQAIKEEAK